MMAYAENWAMDASGQGVLAPGVLAPEVAQRVRFAVGSASGVPLGA